MNAQTTATAAEIFGGPVYSYSRADALDDGYLVDVTETAREAGFRYPVALTRAAWDDCVAWDDDDTKRKHWPQDEAGRLWDVLYMARFAGKRNAGASCIAFGVLRVPREGRGTKARLVTLTAHVGPGDDTAPVVTIGLPNDF
ncbi:MAG: hypothetical protein EPN36_12100 [Rhodanobacteraceae bacterium]|nr:MAG: hypothetical protein EPN36_12100 [Rhodanobacteraceae bacterium]